MKIDCRNLTCPEPIIKIRDALNQIQKGDQLEILLNEKISIINVKKFLSSLKLDFKEYSENLYTTFIATKDNDLNLDFNEKDYLCEVPKSDFVIYLNDDRAGAGELGLTLLPKLLSSFASLEIKPRAIICVNNAVKIPTNKSNPSYQILKNFENLGIEILVCGACLQGYKLVDKLSIGRISNAYEIALLLSQNREVKL